jgi:hypothetical protein
MVFIEQKPLLNHELVRHAIVVLGKNVLFLPPLLAAVMRGPSFRNLVVGVGRAPAGHPRAGISGATGRGVQGAAGSLWNTALDSAYAAIDGKAAAREGELTAREAALALREGQFVEQTQAARAATLEESLALARDQLTATNSRADRLETLLQGREVETERLRARTDALDAGCQELRAKLDAAAQAHQSEREKLNSRHAANEARWLVEIDRGRQAAKETAKDHERQLKELRAQVTQIQTQRDELKRDLQEAR